MLNVDSNRVEYEFDDWTLNDSVFSVLGILKSVQNVGDRQVLINELRGDLVTVNEAKAVLDVQELSRFEYNTETNKYLDVKDYYSIINNCNIYLARVDPTLEKNNIRLMLPEYVAVKSVRAWTYLQLAINYNSVPYFTEPILTHSVAEEIAKENGILFHTDAVQAFGQVPINVDEMNIDMLSASAHKIHGPKGSGVLFIKDKTKIRSIVHGGGQEKDFRYILFPADKTQQRLRNCP